MSKSYKKFPCVKAYSAGAKKMANRKFRRSNKFEDIPLNEKGYYRKCTNQYDIWDYGCYYPESQVMRDIENEEYSYRCNDEKDHIDWWERCFLRK